MKKLMVVALATYSMASWAGKQGCEDAVDMADSLDFGKMHVECADDPITLYDPKSKGKFLPSKKAVTTYGEKQADNSSVSKPSRVVTQPLAGNPEKTEVQQELADKENVGVLFNIREPFTITGAPQSALNGLFVQMAQYCEQGWRKEKEWVEPAESGCHLHYQFRCAE